MIIRLLTLFFLLFSSLLMGNETSRHIANLIASPFYQLNGKEIRNILKEHMIENPNIRYITIYDSLTKERFIFLYKNRAGEILNENFDEKSLQIICNLQSSNIIYKNEIIGKMNVCERQESSSVQLTKEEKEWIRQNPIIKVHNEYKWAPFNFNRNNTPTGYSIDYIKLIGKITGLKIKFVTGTWEESLERAYNKKIDVMLNIAKTKEREKHLLYTSVYARNTTSILTKNEREDISNIDSLFGKKVSVVKGFFYESFLKDNYPKIEIKRYDNTLQSIKAVLYGEVDATLGKTAILNYLMAENVIKGLKYTDDVKADDPEVENLYIAVRDDAPILQSIIKKAIRDINIQDIDALKLKWFNEKRKIKFTNSEYTWLNKKRVIRYSEINWKPLSIIEKNSMSGMIGDYLNIISDTTGIEFKYIPSNSWPEVLEKFKKGEIDLVPGIGDSKEETKLGLVSNKFASYPMVIVTNDNIEFAESLGSIKNRVFSLPENYTSYNYVKAFYPNAKIIKTKNIFESLLNVSNHKADVFVGHIAPALYNISKIGKSNLKIAGTTGKMFNHHFLINKDMPEFLSIVNKVFETLSERDREKIYNGWVKVKVEQNAGFSIKKILSYLFPVVLVVFVIGVVILYWNTKLRSLVAKKTADINSQKEKLEQTLDTLDKNVIFSYTDLEGKITHASEAFCKTSGYKLEELVGKPHKIVRHPDTPKELYKKLWKNLLEGKSWQGEIKNRNKSGNFYWLYSKIELDFNKDGVHLGYKAISENITDKKLVEDLSKNLEKKVEERTLDLELAKKEIESIHKLTQDSIEYASLIQHALIPRNAMFKEFFSDYLTIWHPKDIVGGDIYLFDIINEDECILMVIDCTGHGVPGAFVTMLVKAIERQLLSNQKNSKEEIDPAHLLAIFNKSMKHLLKQEDKSAISNAGFDGGILSYNRKTKIVKFAGAQTPLFYEKGGEVTTIKGDKESIGYRKSNRDFVFTNHIIEAVEGMQFYLTTDGYLDQIGGKRGFSFGKNRFKKLIENNYELPFADQQEVILYEMMEYQGDYERNDDIAIVGFKI